MGNDIAELVLPGTHKPVYKGDERYGPKPGRLPNPIRIEKYTPLPPQHNPDRELHIEAPEYEPWPNHPAPEPKHDMGDATLYDINAKGTTYDDGRFVVIQNGSYSRHNNDY